MRLHIWQLFSPPITKPVGKYFLSPAVKIRYSYSPYSCDEFALSDRARRYLELEKIWVEIHILGTVLYSSFEVVSRRPHAPDAKLTQCDEDDPQAGCYASILTPFEYKSEQGQPHECRRNKVPRNRPHRMNAPAVAVNEKNDEP